MSVACRKDRSNFGIWHPLWFPKVVLDGVEDRERAERLASSPSSNPLSHYPSSSDHLNADLEPMSLHGNDGLVPVSSARWGEFLGTIENCDHWEIRGGGGLRNLNLSFNLNLNNLNLGEAMSFLEWRKESGAKTKADRENREVERESKDNMMKILENSGEELERRKRAVKDAKEERDVKALTDRLSAVVDWLVDRSTTSSSSSTSSDKSRTPTVSEVKKKVEEKKLDLERFYIALCRKLYDDGL